MVLSTLAEAMEGPGHRVVSTDLFDTVLLRDATTESVRFDLSARRAAPRLGADAVALAALRWTCHDSAYRAVAVERPSETTSTSSSTGGPTVTARANTACTERTDLPSNRFATATMACASTCVPSTTWRSSAPAIPVTYET